MTEPKLRSAPVRPSLGSRIRRATASAWVWDGVLALITIAWSLVFIKLYFPGRVNTDIANQYSQAVGDIPFSDWHPPVMSAVWRVLIELTGEPGSLLVLQIAMLALASWAIGVLAHRIGAPRWVSLLGPAVMVTPWVLSQSTTLWKDTQMAVSLLLAVVLLMVIRLVPQAWLLWLPSLVLLVYAVGVRKNAVFAVVPIVIYCGYCLLPDRWRVGKLRSDALSESSASTVSSESSGSTSSRLRGGLATAAMSLIVLALIGGGVKATDAMIASRDEVEQTGQISQIFLDDVMFSVPEAELQASDAPAELKDHISSARDKCLEMGEIWDAYWNCYGKGENGKSFAPIAYQDQLKDLWLSEVITHPLRYAEYRAAVFSYYFFSSSVEYWPAGWHYEAEKAGIEAGDAKADYIVRPYVEDFALGTFPMLFKPWFWTLSAVMLLGLGLRARRQSGRLRHRSGQASLTGDDSGQEPSGQEPSGQEPSAQASGLLGQGRTLWPEVTMLATSALCYIVGYFPIVPANHFRYTFWPALAVTVALVLVLAMWRSGRLRGGRSAGTTPPTHASSESET